MHHSKAFAKAQKIHLWRCPERKNSLFFLDFVSSFEFRGFGYLKNSICHTTVAGMVRRYQLQSSYSRYAKVCMIWLCVDFEIARR